MPASEKIRVLRIQSRICIGGPALNTILLSAHLDPNRYETLLVGGRLEPGEKTMAPLAEEKGVALRQIDEMGRAVHWADDLRALWRLIRLIRVFRPHIVHTHTAKAGAIGRVAAFLCGVPFRLHTFHGHVFHGYFSPLKTRIYIFIERFLAQLSHRIVVISKRQKEDICEIYKAAPAFKTRIVPLGFELDKVCAGRRGCFRANLGLSDGVTLVGILARLVPIKNHQLLLHAINHWHGRNPTVTPDKVRFVFVGDGELRSELEDLAVSLGIASFVVFAGWRREVADIYADIDLNVLVSKNEGTPVTLIEGLANGLSMLATDVGGIRDFADESHGVIVPADATPALLGEKLGEMLPGGTPPPRLSEAARANIRARFDVSRLVADMEGLYTELIAERKGGSL